MEQPPPRELARGPGHHGELVLRVAADGHHEVVSDGMFLMDTRDGRSERGLVELGLAAATAHDRVLVGGLGVGWSLGAALRAEVARVEVAELEPAVVELVRRATGTRTGADLDDPRVVLHLDDVAAVLADDEGWDAICLDVDNGPDWTLGPDNDRLYEDAGIARAVAHLRPGGALAVWGARPVPWFTARLRAHLDAVEVHRWSVPRGEPDVVWVGRRR